MKKTLLVSLLVTLSIGFCLQAQAKDDLPNKELGALKKEGLAEYRKGNFKKAEKLLNNALALAKKDSLDQLEVLNNLWITYFRMNDIKNAKVIKERYDALDKKLDKPPDMVFTKRKRRATIKRQALEPKKRVPVKAERILTVSGLTLRKNEEGYYVEGLLINRTKTPYRSVTIDMELTMDDANEEFETIFLKGIGPETSKDFRKPITLESKTARPVMATVVKVNSLDFDSFDFYKLMRK